VRVGVRLCVIVLCVAVMGCKRTSGSSASTATNTSGGGSSAAGGGDHSTAKGSGAVSVVGNTVTYQNVHVEVPWRVDDVSQIMRMAQEAAAGKGLKLSDGETTVEISSDGRRVSLNGKACGNVQEGDRVTLRGDGKLLVNGAERATQPATKAAG
jgi:hypothetical protein